MLGGVRPHTTTYSKGKVTLINDPPYTTDISTRVRHGCIITSRFLLDVIVREWSVIPPSRNPTSTQIAQYQIWEWKIILSRVWQFTLIKWLENYAGRKVTLINDPPYATDISTWVRHGCIITSRFLLDVVLREWLDIPPSQNPISNQIAQYQIREWKLILSGVRQFTLIKWLENYAGRGRTTPLLTVKGRSL